ncbi:MAG: hypothetical protein M1480_20370, partial [Bacteroidetes bacterium]|nr:hypothetical protein [Bacteroidota bacterium]
NKAANFHSVALNFFHGAKLAAEHQYYNAAVFLLCMPQLPMPMPCVSKLRVKELKVRTTTR